MGGSAREEEKKGIGGGEAREGIGRGEERSGLGAAARVFQRGGHGLYNPRREKTVLPRAAPSE